MSADGLTYTFKIRDAKFSNGDPVTVDDVVFTLQTLSDPAKYLAFVLKPVKAISAADDRHVKIELKEPYAPLLSALSAYAASIVQKKAYQADAVKFGTSPVCAGPFSVESYQRGSTVVLKANPHYWDIGADGKALPYLEGVELRYVPESNSRVLGLRNGDYDAISTVAFNQAKSLESDPKLVIEIDAHLPSRLCLPEPHQETARQQGLSACPQPRGGSRGAVEGGVFRLRRSAELLHAESEFPF